MNINHAIQDCKQNSTSRPDNRPRAAHGGELARPQPARSADVTRGPGTLPDSEFLISCIRTATLRARVAANELDTIGMSLRRNLVSVEGAVAWLHDVDLLDHVIYQP